MLNEPYLIELWQEWTREQTGAEAQGPSLKELVERSNDGDEHAVRLMDFAGGVLGKGMVTLVHLFNPSLIILGGELALNNSRLQQQVKQHIEQRCMPLFAKHVRFEESLTRLDAGIIGAGSLALHEFFEHLHINLITGK
jgi:glucokinase